MELIYTILNAASEEDAIMQIQAHLEIEEEGAKQALSITLGDLIGKSTTLDQDELSPTSATPKEKEGTYRTQLGRKVYGGGGIKPDIEIKRNNPPGIVAMWERQRLFFDFALERIGADSLLAQTTQVPTVDDATVEAFIEYLVQQETDDELDREGQRRIEELNNLVDEMGWSTNVAEAIDQLEKTIKAENTRRVFDEKIKEYVRFYLKRNLVLRLKGRNASLMVATENDNQVQGAVKLLKDLEQYNKVLNKKAS